MLVLAVAHLLARVARLENGASPIGIGGVRDFSGVEVSRDVADFVLLHRPRVLVFLSATCKTCTDIVNSLASRGTSDAAGIVIDGPLDESLASIVSMAQLPILITSA